MLRNFYTCIQSSSSLPTRFRQCDILDRRPHVWFLTLDPLPDVLPPALIPPRELEERLQRRYSHRWISSLAHLVKYQPLRFVERTHTGERFNPRIPVFEVEWEPLRRQLAPDLPSPLVSFLSSLIPTRIEYDRDGRIVDPRHRSVRSHAVPDPKCCAVRTDPRVRSHEGIEEGDIGIDVDIDFDEGVEVSNVGRGCGCGAREVREEGRVGYF